jgi:hypothetical protein
MDTRTQACHNMETSRKIVKAFSLLIDNNANYVPEWKDAAWELLDYVSHMINLYGAHQLGHFPALVSYEAIEWYAAYYLGDECYKAAEYFVSSICYDVFNCYSQVVPLVALSHMTKAATNGVVVSQQEYPDVQLNDLLDTINAHNEQLTHVGFQIRSRTTEPLPVPRTPPGAPPPVTPVLPRADPDVARETPIIKNMLSMAAAVPVGPQRDFRSGTMIAYAASKLPFYLRDQQHHNVVGCVVSKIAECWAVRERVDTAGAPALDASLAVALGHIAPGDHPAGFDEWVISTATLVDRRREQGGADRAGPDHSRWRGAHGLDGGDASGHSGGGRAEHTDTAVGAQDHLPRRRTRRPLRAHADRAPDTGDLRGSGDRPVLYRGVGAPDRPADRG